MEKPKIHKLKHKEKFPDRPSFTTNNIRPENIDFKNLVADKDYLQKIVGENQISMPIKVKGKNNLVIYMKFFAEHGLEQYPDTLIHNMKEGSYTTCWTPENAFMFAHGNAIAEKIQRNYFKSNPHEVEFEKKVQLIQSHNNFNIILNGRIDLLDNDTKGEKNGKIIEIKTTGKPQRVQQGTRLRYPEGKNKTDDGRTVKKALRQAGLYKLGLMQQDFEKYENYDIELIFHYLQHSKYTDLNAFDKVSISQKTFVDWGKRTLQRIDEILDLYSRFETENYSQDKFTIIGKDKETQLMGLMYKDYLTNGKGIDEEPLDKVINFKEKFMRL